MDQRDLDEMASCITAQKNIYQETFTWVIKYEARGKTWKDFKSALKWEFSPKIDSHDMHKQLERKRKKDRRDHVSHALLQNAENFYSIKVKINVK